MRTAGFEPLTETIIRGDTIGIIVWTEKPIGILIKNATAAKSYDQYFQVPWMKKKNIHREGKDDKGN